MDFSIQIRANEARPSPNIMQVSRIKESTILQDDSFQNNLKMLVFAIKYEENICEQVRYHHFLRVWVILRGQQSVFEEFKKKSKLEDMQQNLET